MYKHTYTHKNVNLVQYIDKVKKKNIYIYFNIFLYLTIVRT